ncbi:SDR family oxidoreductase [Halobellus captivus]|uniref:SDR family oxidoreductase n=1 Tax=Halobellus captivus TaxID=2592614 RepID=UPI0011A27F87|nr:SDR family oxidoreductase [Halobellus captivus]
MVNSLETSTVVVTGAASGIGAETARKFAHKGANVIGFDIEAEDLREHFDDLEEETGAELVPIQVDLTVEDQVEAAVQRAASTFDGIDILVNNAGVALSDEVEGMETETYRAEMGVNVDGTFFTTRAALPHIRAVSGNIIFLGSYAGCFPRPYSPVYAATKWWIRGFAKSLAGQIADDEVAITVINPSEVHTNLADGAMKERFDEEKIASPKDIASAITFAASQEEPLTVSELDLYRRNRFRDF